MAKLEYLNKQENLPALIAPVEIKKIFDQEEGKFGITKSAVVVWRDKEYYNTFKEKDFNLIEEGKILTGTKKFYKGSVYFEWYEGSVNPEAHKEIKQSVSPEIRQESKDDTQERIIKGMCLNCACRIILRHDISDTAQVRGDLILKQAKEIYGHCKDWLTS